MRYSINLLRKLFRKSWTVGLTSLSLLCGMAPFASAQCQTDFAILNPINMPHAVSGIDGNEPYVIAEMCERFGWSYKFVDFTALNTTGSTALLNENGTANFKALVSPGGTMAREANITPAGNANVRQFINSGGGYVSFCGGSFQACSNMMWAGETTLPHAVSDYQVVKSVETGLQLFPGTGWGPFGWVVAKGHHEEPTKINANSSTLQAIGMPPYTSMPYAGGPVFVPTSAPPAGYEVWGIQEEPKTIQTQYGQGLVGQGHPSVIKFNYGQGVVVCFAHHPAMIPGGQINGVQVVDPSLIAAWAPAGQGISAQELNNFNYNSWNILHAAMQLITHQQPTKLQITGSSTSVASGTPQSQ